MRKPTAQEQQAAMRVLSQSAAAWLVGMSPRTFRDTDAPREPDGCYDASRVVEWIKTKAGGAGDGDPLLSGADSPNLERYRAARADLAEMDAAERRQQLVDVEEFVDWFATEVGAPLRRAIETIERLHGPAAAEILVRAVEKAQAAIERRGNDD